MTKRILSIGFVLTCGMLVSTAQAIQLFDFEVGGSSNGQGWGSFGVPTTDSGATTQHTTGDYGRFHAFNMGLGSWGIVDRSPTASDATYGFGDLSGYIGISADVKLTLNSPATAVDTVELLLAIGSDEWASFHTLTTDFQTISADFADLIPQSTATDPITLAQLADPDLQIKLVIRRGDDVGRGALRYDNIQAYVPEPGALVMLVSVGLLALRRR